MKPEFMLSNARPSTGWNPWPVSIIAFFTVAIIGCGTFIAFCNRHPADLVAADYYEQEVRYQGEIERLQNAQRQAPTASVSYDPTVRHIKIELPLSHTQAGLSGTIRLYRPSALNLDRQLTLAPGPEGSQTIDAADLLPGLWKVRVAWSANHQDFLIDRQIVVGPSQRYSAR